MENGQLPDDKLFRAVHDRLSDYEAPYNGADWDAMSRSLNSLPKTSRFQWRISLNSILVILGVTGLSVLGYAVATHTNHGKMQQPVPQVTTPVTNTQPQNNSVAVNTSLPTNTNSTSSFNTQQESNMADIANSSQGMNGNVQMAMNNGTTNDLSAQNGKVKSKKRNDNGLFFGDQIDPRKGFIYNTQEDKNALTPPGPISNPEVFYDKDNNGNVRKIILKDSSDSKKGKLFTTDSTASNNKPFAPIDSDQKGFDPEAQR